MNAFFGRRGLASFDEGEFIGKLRSLIQRDVWGESPSLRELQLARPQIRLRWIPLAALARVSRFAHSPKETSAVDPLAAQARDRSLRSLAQRDVSGGSSLLRWLEFARFAHLPKETFGLATIAYLVARCSAMHFRPLNF